MAPKKVVIAVTSSNEAFYPDGKKTGLYWSEASHPYHAFKKAGFEIDFSSESGSYGIDEHSISGPPFVSEADLAEYKDENNEVKKALANIKKTSDINAKEYGIFFAAGGHGCLYDFPTARQLQTVAEEIYQNGGIVSAVCHGPSILEGIYDRNTGELLVKGKSVTGFTDRGETALDLDESLTKNNLRTLEPFYKEAGAKYTPPAEPFESIAITDGRLVTGANPASALATAEQAISLFKKL